MSGTLSLTFNVSAAPFNVSLPIVENPGDPITFTINWGDLTTPDSLLTHTYATNASFTAVVTITAGSVTTFGSGVGPSWTGVDILTDVSTNSLTNWGLPGVTSFQGAFFGAALLVSVPTYVPSSVTNMNSMFRGATLFDQNISSWNVSNVTNMSAMFNNAAAFNQNISSWNVSNVTSMGDMFNGAAAFNQNISGWNVSSVTDMSWMFGNASVFNNGGVALTWTAGTGTSNVTSMGDMFHSAAAFNQNISSWNVSSVTNMSGMFNGATIFNQNIGTWSVSNVINMSGMFLFTAAFNQNISSWNVSQVTDMSNMFFGATAFNQNISSWNVSSVTNMTSMFQGTTIFNQNIGGWNVSQVTDMSAMFYSASAFNNNGAALTWTAGTGTSNVQFMYGVFQNATAFNQDISSWNVSSVITLNSMFDGASAFNQPIGSWNVSNVTNMNFVFKGASAFNQDISSWNVSNVTSMSEMFSSAVLFDQNIRVWLVGSGTDLSNMFAGATAMAATYSAEPGYGNTPLYTFFNQEGPTPPAPYPCFLEGTKILCLENDQEVYRPVQSLRKGDLVKTIYNGYMPIHMIGTTALYNPGNDYRVANRLYKCPREKYPTLFEDLYITGCHSILVPQMTDDQWENTKAVNGDVFVTDNHFRLVACADEKASPFNKEGFMNIYHIALEHHDILMNYGIYANGLLVESCSERNLRYLSNMRILGEEDCSVSENVNNVFSRQLVDTY